MAELRVRLKFDYPPPAEPHNHHMWMLLNPEHLRTVTDLSDLIRARYYPSQRGALSLYVHDCLLPPAESVRLIRDNDVIRVQWVGHDLEDDSDSDNHGCQSKKRSRKRYEEEEDASTLTPKKQKCEELSAGFRRKVKKKKSEERAQEQETASKILSLLRPNTEPPTKKMRVRSSSSSQEETSTIVNKSTDISIQPITTIEVKNPSKMTLHLFAALSVKKKSGKNLPTLLSINKKPLEIPPSLVHVTNHETSDQEPSTRAKEPPKVLRKPEATNSAKKTKSKHESSEKRTRETSSSDSETSSDQEPSTRTKEPPEVPRKAEATNSAKKTKSKHESSEKRTRETSSSDSETSSDQEPSTRTKEPPEVPRKAEATNSAKKTKSKHESSEKRTRETSSSDSETSSDQEPSTRTKEPPEVPRKAEATNSAKKTTSKHELHGENATVMSPSEASTIGKKAGTPVSINQNVPNHKSGAERTRLLYEQNPVGATSNPSEAIAGFPCEVRNRKDRSTWDNGGTKTSRLADAVTVSPHNGLLSPVCDSHARPVEAQCLFSVTTGGVHQKHDNNRAVFGRGRGQGIERFPWRGQGARGFRGRGDRGRGQRFFHDYDSATLKKHQLEDVVTNTSVIIENPPQSPAKDYDTFPLLAAPPQAGRVIAFKILELNENYSPELSDYKEGVVCSYDHVTQLIEVELLSKQKKREPGKFDLVYESEDGQEIVEYAVVPECKITEPWSSLITPRLVMEKRSEEGSSPRPQ